MSHYSRFTVFAFLLLSTSLSMGAELIDLIPAARAMGFQNSAELEAYFEISEINVEENQAAFSPEELAQTGIKIANGSGLNPGATPNGDSPAGGLTSAIGNLTGLGDVKQWITIGLKIWDIVKANQPIIGVKTQTVSVLPQSLPDWQQMETWKGPAAKSYTISAKNFYGATVVSHTYTVAFHYGGSYRGHGRFLAHATIIPTDVQVAWGFTLNSDVKVGDPLNTGTIADPVPAIGLGLEWSMSSLLKKTQGQDEFFVRGDGTAVHVNASQNKL